MIKQGQQSSPPRRRRWTLPGALGVLTLATLAAAAWLYYNYFPGQLGPPQPISYSHRFHVTDKKLSCYFCHTGAIDTERAGLPPLQTCMLCHDRIIATNPQIAKLRDHFDRKDPIEWVRVNDLPNYVYFNHQRHINKGVDCGRCHGQVDQMDRVTYVQKFDMGFCVQCHRDENYSHDCLICHR